MDNVFFYVVDTGNLWTLYGKLSEEEARPLLLDSSLDLHEATVSAGLRVSAASAARATAADSAGQEALNACVRYLGRTITSTEVQRKNGGISGHWLVFVYHFGSSDILLRPAFVDGEEKQSPLAPAKLMQVMMSTVENDLHAVGGHVGSLLRDRGNPVLAPALATKLRKH